MGGRGQQHNEAAITPAWTPITSPHFNTGAESAKETVKVLRSRDTGKQGGYRMERRVTKNSMYRGEQHNIYFSVFHSVPKITLGSLIRLIGYFISLNIFVFVPPDCCYARYSAALLQCLRESIQMERRYFTAKWLRPTITITPRHARCSSGNFRGFPSSNCNSFSVLARCSMLHPLYWPADTAPTQPR